MKILLVGGGSGGPVSPLLAVAEEIKKVGPQSRFLLVGTKNGPESAMAQDAGIAFKHIAAGKLRRYFSLQNLFSPVLIFIGFFQSLSILNSYKPDCVFGTGSFVQVPLVWAAWLKKIPVVLHQQDLVPSLANKLGEFVAQKITVTFPESVNSFPANLGIFYKKSHPEKIILTGNPFRESLVQGSKQRAAEEFSLSPDLPVLLVLGGGTGAEFINNLIAACADQLSKTVQIIHSTGKDKTQARAQTNYRAYEFIANMADAYAAADIVLARGGLSTLTELSNLKKLAIIVPMPDSHQEDNAALVAGAGAAIVLSQSKLNGDNLTNFIRKLLFANQAQETLKANIGKIMPHGAAKKIADIVLKLAGSHDAKP